MIPVAWHSYRRDDHLSAHSPLTGAITDPALLWSLPIGGTHQIVVPFPSAAQPGPPDLLFCYGGVVQRVTVHGEERWRSAPLGIHGIAAIDDIDADGRWEIVVSNGLEVIILSADTGAVLWRARYGPPDFYGVYASTLRVHRCFPDRRDAQVIVPALHNRAVHILDFSEGAARGRVLHSLEMGDAFHPTVVIGDVDRDGLDEIVVTRLGSVAVFDPRTGAGIASSTWETDGSRRRGYGQVMLHDIDGDGDLELVVLARQVTRHIAVLDNNGKGEFTPLWDRLIEHIYPTDHTDLRYCLNAVCDADGDGAPEIVVSIFDDRNDGRWYTELINAKTGETKVEFPDTVIRDARDIDGDGRMELLMQHCTDRIPSGRSTLQLFRCENGAWRQPWARPDARFAGETIGQTVHTGKYRPALFEMDRVWSDAGGLYLFDHHDRLIHVDLRTDEDALIFAPSPEARGMHFVVARSGARMVVTDGGGLVTVLGHTPIALHCGMSLATDGHPVERPSPTPVVFAVDGRRFICVPDSGDAIALYEARGNETPVLRWRVPGRGRIGFDRSHHSVSIADINNDGIPEILFTIPGDHSVLVAVNVAGDIVARYDLHDMPSIAAGPRTGCYDWCVFDDDGKTRVFISCYRSESMNSELSMVLDAATGAVIWRRDIVGEETEGVGFGAWGLASVDGTTAYFCAKAYVCIVDLRTGELVRPIIHLTELTRDAMKAAGTYVDNGVASLVTKDDPFTAYGSVVLRDIDGDGAAELLVMGCLGGFGVLNHDGSTRWWRSTPLTDIAYRLGGVCDVDGDGALELGLGHSNGAFVCYDANTGVERWRIDLGPTTIDCATCDIDGDGRDEFICRTTDGRVLAIGVSAAGDPVIKWETRFAYAAGNPVIADITGNGSPTILAAIGDGTLVCVGARQP